MFYCEQCQQQVKLVTINQASLVLMVTRRTIYNYIAANRVHIYKTASGRFRICMRSLVGPEATQKSATLVA